MDEGPGSCIRSVRRGDCGARGVVVDWAFNVTNPGRGPADGPGDVENAGTVLLRWR
jgi:hypothetical protein